MDNNSFEDKQDAEVPLYYVTKAWDVLLKNSLGVWSFMIGPEEDEDISEESLKLFLKYEGATWSRVQAEKSRFFRDFFPRNALGNTLIAIDIEKTTLNMDYICSLIQGGPKQGG